MKTYLINFSGFDHLRGVLKMTILFLMTTVLVTMVSPVTAQTLKAKTSKMTVSGSSTIHEWESEITKADFNGDVKVENQQLKIRSFEARIPVTSIKSTKGKTMDTKTYEAFKSEKFPTIIFSITNTKINANGTLDAKGYLTMAGVTQPVELQQVNYKILPGGDVQITLSKKINMTQWKMEPPTAMMGTIKVGEEVTVNFDFTIDMTPNQ
jgi:polyisoprenoid-binding protein YceI